MASARWAPGDPDGERLPRASRIRRTREIRALVRHGARTRTLHLDVFFSFSFASRPRVGIVVPKHRHTVAERNLLRRRLREIARRDVLPRLWRMSWPVDFLVRARPKAYDASAGRLRSELMEVMEAL